jgi:hypothetical protein
MVPPGFPNFMSRAHSIPSTREPAAGPGGDGRTTGPSAVTEGLTELLCRATDQLGHSRPVHQPWNRQGMANNMVQRIPVLVRGT